MRLTCLKCGHQSELAGVPTSVQVSCVCGLTHTYPEVVNTGIQPSERAALRSRSRAFRAAGLVKNIGGFALGLALLSIAFFPLGVLAALVGLYVLTMLRGPVGFYSGRRQAVVAVFLGMAIFVAEGTLALHWIQKRRDHAIMGWQQTVHKDLRILLRTERLFKASRGTYGSFDEFRFKPTHGRYTVYLSGDDYFEGIDDREAILDPLPEGVQPGLSEDSFTAVAVANLDGDPALDVWTLDNTGAVYHLRDDLSASESGKIRWPPAPDLVPDTGIPVRKEGKKPADEAVEAPEPEKPTPLKPHPEPQNPAPTPKVPPKSAEAKPEKAGFVPSPPAVSVAKPTVDTAGPDAKSDLGAEESSATDDAEEQEQSELLPKGEAIPTFDSLLTED